MNEQDAASWLESLALTLEQHKEDLPEWINTLEKTCPGYVQTFCGITSKALKTVVGAVLSRP